MDGPKADLECMQKGGFQEEGHQLIMPGPTLSRVLVNENAMCVEDLHQKSGQKLAITLLLDCPSFMPKAVVTRWEA